MGSRGMKRPRKGSRGRSRTSGRGSVRDRQRRERQAIADTMGFGRTPAWVKWTAIIAVAAMVLAGVASLVTLA